MSPPAGDVDSNGNDVDTDSCTAACKQAICGDGIVGPGEACDDGNMVDDDACSDACATASCGDGKLQQGEECDDGDGDDGDACLSTCKNAICGDLAVQVGVEECDDGDMDDSDACLATCKAAKCGDAVVQAGVEECDDGDMDDSDACLATCKAAKCGDGVVQAGVEECDDGNQVDNDTCTNACKLPKCGDGVVQAPEQCDDGNGVNADTCSLLCHKSPKTVSLVAGQTTQTFGGGGGAPFNLTCPVGQVLIGFNGRSAALVDQLTGVCGTPSIGVANDKFVVKLAQAGNLQTVGGGGGGPFNSPCPVDKAIIGFSGRSGANIDAIRFSCAPLAITEDGSGFKIASGAVTNLTQFGGGGGGVIPQTNCPAGQIGSRKVGRSGALIDQFGLGCSTFGLTF